MNMRLKYLVLLIAISSVLASGKAATAPGMDSALQAIQQAPDPSSVISAYANGFAIDRNNPKLYDAYVSRMVELGLPEMAYYQARTLTTLQADNGQAWGVVAYVDARRGQMSEALSAINLAGQFAPDNSFIQRTSGELVAWYDTKADKNQVPENVKQGLGKVRGLLDKRATFTEAYAAAQKAYQTQASVPAQPAPGTYAPAPAAGSNPVTPNALEVPNAPAAPLAPQAEEAPEAASGYAYGAPPAAPAYYPPYAGPAGYPFDSGAYLDWGPDYYYDWGPGWVAPTPWSWWQPFGFWGGCSFFPFGFSFAFGNFHDFHHFHHDHFFDHGGRFDHGRGFAHGRDPAFWHHGGQNRADFFGAPASPAASVTHWNHALAAGHTIGANRLTTASPSLGASRAAARTVTVNRNVGGAASTVHSLPGNNSSVAGSDPAVHSSRAGAGGAFRSDPAVHRAWPGQNSMGSSRSFGTTHSAGSGGGAFRSVGGAPMGASRTFNSPMGSFHSAGSVNGGFRSGGFNGGGFRGGGFSSGGFHGGGVNGGVRGGGFGGGFHGGGGGGFHGGGGGGFHGGGGGGHR